MAPRSRKKSKKSRVTETKPDSEPLDLDHERDRFLEFSVSVKESTQLFSQLVENAGLNKVQQYNNELDTALNLPHLSKHNPRKFGFLIKCYQDFRKGKTGSFDEILELIDENDDDKIMSLIRCAYFVRSLGSDDSELTKEVMLAQIAGSDTNTNQQVQNQQVEKVPKWSTDVVLEGFNAEYQKHDLIVTPTLETLTKFAQDWRRDTFKAPYTSIIGPTMSGKTRLLIELAKSVCVVYVCLRETTSTGQPPRSELARHFLPVEKPDFDLIKHYSQLLAAIFDTVSEFFSRPEIKDRSWQDRLTAWYKYSFQVDKKDLKDDFNQDIENAMKKMQNETNRLKLLPTAAERFSKNIHLKGHGQLKVLLAIDEASHLIKPVDTALNIPYFRVFRRVLSEIPPSKGFFSVFTDTTSRVANFSPSLSLDRSARYYGAGFELYPPIFKISTLDLFVPKAPTSWDELLSPERLFNYGCPFYGLYFKGALKKTESLSRAINDTVMIAEAKLLLKKQSTQSTSSQALDRNRCFAILGSVIQTRVSLHSPINSELVSSHAAHCIFIDSSRETIVSEYPPQFVYASVANTVLARSDDCWVECIKVLAYAVQHGLVALGDAGEMAVRLILIRAMQQTAPINSNQSEFIPNGQSVRLIDFLQTLSGKDPHSMEFGFIEEANKARLLEEGLIFFNHFSRIAYTPSADHFLELLYRGVAAQCKRGQSGFDELFTIYLAPKSESGSPKLKRENITFCGVQTKNQAGSVNWGDSLKWSKSYAGIQDINNPYLVILFSLRTNTRNVPEWTPPTESNDTGRVSYQFLGLGDIACLTPEMRSALDQLITAIPEDLMKLYDDPDAVTQNWVKQLNPVFYPPAPDTSDTCIPETTPKYPKRQPGNTRYDTRSAPKRI